jgi:flagellar FliJ protein
MANFTFRLAALLRLRESRRDECRAALAAAYRVDEALAKQSESIHRELEALREFCRRQASPGVVDVDRLVEAQRYELVARARQQRTREQRQTVAAEIERRRQALVEADREVRVLEKLRQRQAEQHRREEELREAKRLDEVAAQQAFRQLQTATEEELRTAKRLDDAAMQQRGRMKDEGGRTNEFLHPSSFILHPAEEAVP